MPCSRCEPPATEPNAKLPTRAELLHTRVEFLFANKAVNDAVRELTKANADKLDVVISDIRAHQALPQRVKLISAMLRQVDLFSDRFGAHEIPDNLLSTRSLQDLSQMEGKVYGEVSLAADAIVRQSKIPPFEERVESLRTQLLHKDVDLVEMAESPEFSAGVDMLTCFFADEDDAVKAAAIEVYFSFSTPSLRIPTRPTPKLGKQFPSKLPLGRSFSSPSSSRLRPNFVTSTIALAG